MRGSCTTCQADFFELGGYRCFPDVVTVDLDIRELMDVDHVNSTYKVHFVLTTRWYDRSFDTWNNMARGTNIHVEVNTVPNITVEHVDHDFEGKGIPNDDHASLRSREWTPVHLRKGGDPPGVLAHSQRIQVRGIRSVGA
jgi:hypothetical protein